MADKGKVMKILMISAAIAGIAAAPAVGGDKPVVESKVVKKVVKTDKVEATDTSAAAIVADCSARKFETSAELEKDGQKRIVKLKLCAAKDGDAAAWVKTLEDARAKIAGHPEISEDSKAKIITELDAEIARIRTDGGASASPSLPPAPPATPQPAPVADAPVPVARATEPALVRTQSLTKPRLTVRCLEQGEHGEGGPCTGLERYTRLAIRADDDLPEGTSLRFLRRGDVRGEIALARMRQGQSVQISLPAKLCAGVASSKAEIQILGSNQVVETLGPYLLRC